MKREDPDSRDGISNPPERSPEYMAKVIERLKKEEAHLREIVEGLGATVGERGGDLNSISTELEKMTNEAQECSENIRTFFQALPAGTAQISVEDTKFLAVNDWFCKMTGYSRSELLGMTSVQITHPDDHARHRQFFDQVRTGRSTEYRAEKRYLRKDGTYIWIQMTVTLIRDSDGRPFRIAAIIQDITRRKQAEEALGKSRARFKAIFDSLSDFVIFADTGRRIQLTNPAFTTQFGYTPDEVKGRNTKFLYANAAEYEELGKKRYNLNEPASHEILAVQYRRKDGTVFWAETAGTQVRDAGGKVLGFVGISRDVTRRKQTEEALRASRERLQKAFSIDTVGVLFFNLDGRITGANAAFERMSGYTSEELRRLRHWQQLTPPEFWDKTMQTAGELGLRGESAPYEKEMLRKDGSRWWGVFAPTRLAGSGLNSECMEFVIDISERKRIEDHLGRSKALSEHLNRINLLVHSTLDATSVMMSALRGAKEALGVDCATVGIFEHGPASGLTISYFLDAPDAMKDLCCSPDQARGIQYMALRKDAFAFNNLVGDERVNTKFWSGFGFAAMLTAPLMVRNEIVGAIMFFSSKPFSFDDMHVDFARKMGVSLSLAFENARLYEQRGKMEEEMRHMAHHDPLTGLPNRRLFLDLVQLELKQANRNRKKIAVLFLDLDRFKEVNDTLGHDVGNRLLNEVSLRLRSLIRKSDTIARIGGDEFNIILADIAKPEDTAEVARNIVGSFRKPFSLYRHELSMTTSIGISIYPDDAEDIDTLLRYADIAMYHAKELGRNRYQFYDRSINIKSLERMHLESMLKRSLELDEMEMYYQPLLDIRTGQILWAEALTRWHHPEKGMLHPKEFIPAAEETGFINELGEWSLKKVCSQMREWLDAGAPPVRITVNLSARQFQDPELVGKIVSILAESGIPAESLGIEITETIAMSNVERSATLMKNLAAMGVHSSIDDFGTGYSSLNYLKRLPIDRLKIDQSFVQDIATDPDDRSIVEAVTAMAHNMKLKVVAEGVETREQLEFLQKTGCDEMQGFYFSKPLSSDEFAALLKAA